MPYGVLFIFVNILYVVFAYALGTIAYFVAKRYYPNYKNRIALGVFFIILLAPFWDLIIQKGIKTYYETFKMESTIYAYPQRDKDGKIESLSTMEADSYSNGFLIRDKSYQVMLSVYKNVKNFVELKIILDNNETTGKYIGKYGEKYIRLSLKDINATYKYMQKNQSQARYKVKATSFEPQLFGLYEKKVFEFIDNKDDTLLSTAWELRFTSNKKQFRNKYLLWKGANGVPFSLYDSSNDKTISENLFGFDYKLNISTKRR